MTKKSARRVAQDNAQSAQAQQQPQQPPVWIWDVFGGGQAHVGFNATKPLPTFRQRFFTRLFLGSKWIKVKA